MKEDLAQLAGTRGRVYALIDAFEADIRSIIVRYVLSELDEKAALGNSYSRANDRRHLEERDPDLSYSIVHYLDLRDAYDILNRNRSLLPDELGREVQENTSLLDSLVAIRRRVAHARPLAPGDTDRTVSILSTFQSRWWVQLQETTSHLQADLTWEPQAIPASDDSKVLHNLPSAEFDETGLVGRTAELEELTSLLIRGREPIITILGEGGVGKTALAVQVAYGLVDHASTPFEAVLWTSLKNSRLTEWGISAITGAPATIYDSLAGIAATVGLPRASSLLELSAALEGVRTLLIVDNLESVGTQEFLDLYDALPQNIQFLVTSRIGVGELERRYTLKPLADKDAIDLFMAYSRSRHQTFLLSRTRDTRTTIVQKLRNSPLAIRWYVLSVESGRDPLMTIRNQSDLLKFCVQSVYDALSESGRRALAGLNVLGSTAVIDDLVLLLDLPSEEVVLAVQQLLRSSLVRREQGSDKSDLRSSIRVTESAAQYLEANDGDSPLREQLGARHQEVLRIEERRAIEASNRSLAPVVIRVRDARDMASAHLLREAILHSQEHEIDLALDRVSRAKELNPDFWEVFRVEGFILGYRGTHEAADRAFRESVRLAKGYDVAEAAVSHFYAGFLARQVQDTESAIFHERVAHEWFDSPETAHALGNYLIWAGRFDEGIPMLEGAVAEADGKLLLIATSAVAEGWLRYSEKSLRDFRNPLEASNFAWKGYLAARSLFVGGVSDTRLLVQATECCEATLRYMRIGISDMIPVDAFDVDFGLVVGDSARLSGNSRYARLEAEVFRWWSSQRIDEGLRSALVDFGRSARRSTADIVNAVIFGQILNMKSSFAFIACAEFPENVFLHISEWADASDFNDLTPGIPVAFSVEIDEQGRPRALSARRSLHA